MYPPKIETDRLTLRPFSLGDADKVTALAGDLRVAEPTLNIPHPYLPGMAQEWIESVLRESQKGESIVFAIEESSSKSLVGAVSLEIRHRDAELGYWIGHAYWGKGYCTEAAQAALEYALNGLSLASVFAEHLVSNPASGRVMVKIGMEPTGRIRGPNRHGEEVDIDIYEKTRTTQ